MRGIPGRFKWKPVVHFVIVAVVSSITVSVYLGVDVVMVEHFFDKTKGGLYSVAAVLGRSVFFATGGIASVQFPKVAARHAKGKSTVSVVAGSLALCAGVGLLGTALLQVFGRMIMVRFAGKSYLGGAHLLGWYGLGMMVLGGCVVLVNTQQSLNEPALLWVLVPMSFLEPLLILLYHRTLLDVVLAADVSIVLFGIVLGIAYIRGELARTRGSPPPVGGASEGEEPPLVVAAGADVGLPAI
jgi:O-antigen/teichoic acid export membrane protein